jgi:hypothetical protein
MSISFGFVGSGMSLNVFRTDPLMCGDADERRSHVLQQSLSISKYRVLRRKLHLGQTRWVRHGSHIPSASSLTLLYAWQYSHAPPVSETI